MFTVTAPGTVLYPDEWNATAQARFAATLRVLRTRLRRAEYARVLEMQRRGVLHVHALMTGWERLDLAWVRSVLVVHGFGPWFEVKPIRDLHAVAGYIAAKYLAKSHEDLGRRYRVVQYSRGWQGFTDAERDDRTWARALNVVDPAVVVPDGMSWGRWADREVKAGRGTFTGSRSTGWPGTQGVLFDDSG